MADWTDTLKTLAPTVAAALGGPLAGAAVSAIGSILGMDKPTQDTIAKAITNGQLSADQIGELKKLEMQYQNDEAERGFKYAELAFKDRDSARLNNVAGGVQAYLFWLSLLLLVITIGSEVYVLFHGAPKDVPDIIIGRILGLLDSVAMLVLTYWYGTTNSSAQKTELLANSQPAKTV